MAYTSQNSSKGDVASKVAATASKVHYDESENAGIDSVNGHDNDKVSVGAELQRGTVFGSSGGGK